MSELKNFHGVHVQLPERWEDVSVLRFLPPSQADSANVPMINSQRKAQPNLIATRHSRLDEDPPQVFFEEMNSMAAADSSSFQLLLSGQGDYLGQQVAWQDSTFTEETLGLKVFQRHMVLANEEQEFVLLTLTGSQQEIKRMSHDIGFFPEKD